MQMNCWCFYRNCVSKFGRLIPKLWWPFWRRFSIQTMSNSSIPALMKTPTFLPSMHSMGRDYTIMCRVSTKAMQGWWAPNYLTVRSSTLFRGRCWNHLGSNKMLTIFPHIWECRSTTSTRMGDWNYYVME